MAIISGIAGMKTGRAMLGSLVLATCLGVAGAATAGPYRHDIVRGDLDALAAPGPVASGSWTGTWRYRMFRSGGCDKAYPMHEGYPCGSVTGGPVGGMGS